MRRLLITGGSGFLGGHLVQIANTGTDFEVHATYNTHPYESGCLWHLLDMTVPNSIELTVARIKPDAIIHNAAMAQVDQCEDDHTLADQINVQASQLLAQLARQERIRFIFISTDMVFDGTRGHYRENDPTNPINYYGRTKVDAENAVLAACPTALVARTALIYGTSVTASRSFYEIMLDRLRANQPISLFDDQYRTPIWVRNLAACLIELVDNPVSGLLHLAGPERMDRFTFGQYVADAFGFSRHLLRRVSMYDVMTKAARPCDVSLDTGKARSLLNTPLMSVAEALERERNQRFRRTD